MNKSSMVTSFMLLACAVATNSFHIGCSSGLRSISTTNIRGPYSIEARHGKYTGRDVASGSQEAVAIERWLNEHRSGWSTSIDTFAPGQLVVRGEKFKLMLHGTNAVFSQPGVVGAKQLVKPLDPQSIAQLQAACLTEQVAERK